MYNATKVKSKVHIQVEISLDLFFLKKIRNKKSLDQKSSTDPVAAKVTL